MNVKTQHQPEFRLARFSLLCSNLVWFLPSSFIIAIALAFVPSEEQISLVVRLSWLAMIFIFLGARLVFLNHWLKHPATDDNLQSRLNLATFFTALTASCFGLYGYFGISPDYPLVSLVIIMIITGMVGSATATVSYILPMYLLFIFPVVLPVSIRMLTLGDSNYSLIGFLMLLYLAGSLWASRNIRASTFRSIELRFENIELLEDLKQEHQRAEIALAREEKANLAKSSFLAAASHDLRQPLHSLRLFTATLELQTRNTEHKTLVNQIDSSVKSLEELFNALLDISKLDAGTISVDKHHVHLDSLLSQIEGEFLPLAKENNLEFSVATDGHIVDTDVPLLETLLRNLVSNAIRYTDKGRVSIETETVGSKVRIAVKDTGVGIAAADQSRIFDEFVQLGNTERDRNQGIGLGLSIVKRVADLLDVQLTVQSSTGTEDHGASFYVDVPAGDIDQCRAINPRLALSSGHLASLFVLVIDDEEEACLAIEGLLETWGCVVMCAASGDTAIQQLKEIGEIPDLVISDYRLRDDETGGDVVRRVRAELGFELPAIILTGDIAPERLQDIKDLNLPLLHKPCEPESLRQLIMLETRPVVPAILNVG